MVLLPVCVQFGVFRTIREADNRHEIKILLRLTKLLQQSSNCLKYSWRSILTFNTFNHRLNPPRVEARRRFKPGQKKRSSPSSCVISSPLPFHQLFFFHLSIILYDKMAAEIEKKLIYESLASGSKRHTSADPVISLMIYNLRDDFRWIGAGKKSLTCIV